MKNNEKLNEELSTPITDIGIEAMKDAAQIIKMANVDKKQLRRVRTVRGEKQEVFLNKMPQLYHIGEIPKGCVKIDTEIEIFDELENKYQIPVSYCAATVKSQLKKYDSIRTSLQQYLNQFGIDRLIQEQEKQNHIILNLENNKEKTIRYEYELDFKKLDKDNQLIPLLSAGDKVKQPYKKFSYTRKAKVKVKQSSDVVKAPNSQKKGIKNVQATYQVTLVAKDQRGRVDYLDKKGIYGFLKLEKQLEGDWKEAKNVFFLVKDIGQNAKPIKGELYLFDVKVGKKGLFASNIQKITK